MSSVIKEFLASVGFKADAKSLKTALTQVAGFGAAIKMITAGIYAGMLQVASGEVAIAQKAKQLGTTAGKMQELGYVAEQSGASMDAVTRAMESLVSKNPRIKDAAKALDTVGQRMRGMTEHAQKLYASRMGIDPSLIPMLTSDVSVLRDEFKAMYAVAGLGGKNAAEASKGFLAEIAKLKAVTGMLAKSITLTFIGRIRADIEHFRKLVVENFDKIKAVFEKVIDAVLRLSAMISAFVYRASKFIEVLVNWFNRLDDSQKKVVIGLALLLAAWRYLNLGFLATPLGMIITGLVAVLALVDDYLTYMEGGESYFDWGPWAETIEKVVQWLTQTGPALLPLIKSISVGFLAAKAFSVFVGVLKSVGSSVGVLGSIFRVLWGIIRANPLGIILTIAMLVYEYWEPITAFFKNLWADIAEVFPDFAALAEKGAAAIKNLLGKAIEWVREKLSGLLDKLPDWAKKRLGLSTAPDSTPPGVSGDFDPATASANAQNTTVGALMPAHASYAARQSPTNNVKLDAATTINVYSSDPVSAGNQVASHQDKINADLVRHTRGSVR